MARIVCFLLLTLCFNLFSESYIDNYFSLNSAKARALGNSYAANASGFESFEYNPAGLMDENGWGVTVISMNFSIIGNIFDLNEDLLDEYNELKGTDANFLGISKIAYLLKSENLSKVLSSLLKQVNNPDEGKYANGLGISPVIYSGFIRNGFGLGVFCTLESEAFGYNLTSTALENVLTTGILVGYSRPIDTKFFPMDVGISLRPMYRIRSGIGLSRLISLLDDNDTSMSEVMKEMDYLTGTGIGWDIGAKGYFKDLIFSLSFIDIFGTKFSYSHNSYENISNGDYLGGIESEDKYVVPMKALIGLAFNPYFGEVNKIINPTISFDYRLLLLDRGKYTDYVHQDSFWTNLSLGLDLEFFELFNLRTGINQGYLTTGAGIKIKAVEINSYIYSKEMGEDAGYRQQMGAGFEVAVRL